MPPAKIGAMNEKRVISASSSRFAAQLFNLITVAVMLISLTALLLGKLLASQKVGFLPVVMSLPPVMIALPFNTLDEYARGAALKSIGNI